MKINDRFKEITDNFINKKKGVNMTLDDIEEQIKNANSIAVFCHENPDGDAIGSSLAVYLLLKGMRKQVDVIIPNYPKIFEFLPGYEEVKKEVKSNKVYELAIAVDCADINRIDDPQEIFKSAKATVNIDHHSTNSMYADYNFVNPVSPACCQILMSICEQLGLEVSKEIGTCLLTGIITDTGGFRYEGVTSETFEFVAEILKKGVKISKIYKQAFSTISIKRFEAKKIAMNKLEFLEDGKIAFTYITKEDMERCGVDKSGLEGIVEVGRDIDGVEVSIFLYEKDDGYRASLRSNEYVNVSDICILFSGGGHAKAAACSFQCSLEEAKEKIISATKKALR